MLASRFARRVGALVLLLTWSQVATANAVVCAAWCAMGGSMHPEQFQADHHHDSEPAHHHGGTSIGESHCGAPQLLLVQGVVPEPLHLPVATELVAEPPIATPRTLLSSFVGFDTPPPRV